MINRSNLNIWNTLGCLVKYETYFVSIFGSKFEVEIDSVSSRANKTFTRFPRFMLLTVCSSEKCAHFTSMLKVYNKLHNIVVIQIENDTDRNCEVSRNTCIKAHKFT
jgi:hypothetical protein